MSVARGLVRNSTLLLIANLVTRISSALLFLIVARFRQPEAAGVFTLAMSYTLLLEAVSQMGLDQLLIRDAARNRDRVSEIFSRLLSIRLGLLTAALLLFAAILALTRLYSDETRLLLFFMAFTALPDVTVDMCQAVFVATDRLKWPSLVSVAAGILRLALGLAVLGFGGTLFHLALAMLSASSIQMLLSILLARREGIKLSLSLSHIPGRTIVSEALPFGVIQLLVAIESYFGSVLLSTAVPNTQLGYYGVANSLLAALVLIPNAIQVAVFPRMTEAHAASFQRLNVFYARVYRYVAVLGGATILAMLVLAEFVAVTLYQAAFRPSALLLQLLGGVLLVYFLNIPSVRAMVILGRQRHMATLLCVSVTFNVLMTILLIPQLGVLAVPLARVASMACFFAMNQASAGRYLTGTPLASILGPPLVALTVSAALIGILSDAPIWLQLPIGLIVYFSINVRMGGLPANERRYLLAIVLRQAPVHDVLPE